jgi:hypothetical protein
MLAEPSVDTKICKALLRVGQLGGVDQAVIPWIDPRSAGADRDDAGSPPS